jgi:hypothetical protein
MYLIANIFFAINIRQHHVHIINERIRINKILAYTIDIRLETTPADLEELTQT